LKPKQNIPNRDSIQTNHVQSFRFVSQLCLLDRDSDKPQYTDRAVIVQKLIYILIT
jgi:hypothetical protein